MQFASIWKELDDFLHSEVNQERNKYTMILSYGIKKNIVKG